MSTGADVSGAIGGVAGPSPSGATDAPVASDGTGATPLVEVRDLVKYFPITSGLLRRKTMVSD